MKKDLFNKFDTKKDQEELLYSQVYKDSGKLKQYVTDNASESARIANMYDGTKHSAEKIYNKLDRLPEIETRTKNDKINQGKVAANTLMYARKNRFWSICEMFKPKRRKK